MFAVPVRHQSRDAILSRADKSQLSSGQLMKCFFGAIKQTGFQVVLAQFETRLGTHLFG